MRWRRRLTGMERWHWLLDRAAPANVVFVARLEGRVDARRLDDALQAVAAHYPVLTARIEPAELPELVSTDERLPLRALPWERGAWRAAAVAEANARFDSVNGPLARAVLLAGVERADLLLSFNQAAADGLSGAQIVDEILDLYGGGPRAAVVAPETLVPPLADFTVPRLAALRARVDEVFTARRLTPLPADRAVPPEERRTALLDARLPAAVTTRLARVASEHGTSVHGALATAMLLSIGVELRGGQHARHHVVGCASSVDLRRRLYLPATLVGNLTSQVVSAHTVHYDALFWDVAAEVSEALRQATASGAVLAHACLQEAGAIGVRDDDVARRVRRAERLHRAAAVIHNLGRLEPYPHYGDVTLERLGFLLSSNAHVGSSLVLSAVTCGDTTCLNFTFAEPLLAAERAQRLVDGTLQRLQEVAG